MRYEAQKPAAWQTNAAGAFLTIGDVSACSLRGDRFRVQCPGDDDEVEALRAGPATSPPVGRRLMSRNAPAKHRAGDV
jgi:hypothetical protein